MKQCFIGSVGHFAVKFFSPHYTDVCTGQNCSVDHLYNMSKALILSIITYIRFLSQKEAGFDLAWSM